MDTWSRPQGRVVIAGGSGFLGLSLAHHLAERGCEVVILSRSEPVLRGPWSHAAWNGSLLLAEDEGTVVVTIVVIVGFIGLFFLTAIGVILLRRRDLRRYEELLPWLAQRYGLAPREIEQLTDPSHRRQARRALPGPERRDFDRRASAVARLAALFDHPGQPDPADEARLVTQLARPDRS